MSTILLASPDPDMRAIFRLALEHAGYRVETLEVVDRLVESASGCALVITDFPTPAAPDCTVTHRLRAHPSTRHVPILNATTHVMPAEIERAAEAGVSATITLPADLTRLVRHVRELIGAP